ncbi:hypothetical protein GCM10023229_36750 [Flavisolibacter ginsenosidimutans]
MINQGILKNKATDLLKKEKGRFKAIKKDRISNPFATNKTTRLRLAEMKIVHRKEDKKVLKETAVNKGLTEYI